jgi:hypothetical protein
MSAPACSPLGCAHPGALPAFRMGRSRRGPRLFVGDRRRACRASPAIARVDRGLPADAWGTESRCVWSRLVSGRKYGSCSKRRRSAGKDESDERADATGRIVRVVRPWRETQGEIRQARHATFTPYVTSNSGRRAARASPITSNTNGEPSVNGLSDPWAERQGARSRVGYRVRRTCAHMDVRTKRIRDVPAKPVRSAEPCSPLGEQRTPRDRPRPSPNAQTRPTSTTPEHLNASPYCRASLRAFRFGSPLTSASNPPLSSSASIRRASTGFANR